MKNYSLRVWNVLKITVPAIILIYLILLIPENDAPLPTFPEKQPFVWNQDSVWLSLEGEFLQAKNNNRMSAIINYTDVIENLLNEINLEEIEPGSEKLLKLENAFFDAAPLAGAYPQYIKDYFTLYSKMRHLIKNKSIYWDMNDLKARCAIYRLLYGTRAAVEEIMLQNSSETFPPELMGFPEPSMTPNADILGVNIHSGDILVSRGGAPTSALIARGNDYPGNFSHIALVYVDEKTHLVSVIESHIERGVTISSLEDYLADKKLRVMVLRLRADLPQLKADPMLPHKAALSALNDARSRHIPYDFEMNYKDPLMQFCSEVAFAPYNRLGINFWKGISNISSPGIVRWLSYFGVKYFETLQPSDLEYDPQLTVVAEWRDPATLYKDHLDNAVIEAMLTRANEGKDIEYPFYMLPFARVIKAYSCILNIIGYEGIIPEGMSAAAALRNEQLSTDHHRIKILAEEKAAGFKKRYNYTPPYWQLVKFAGEAVKELKY